MIRTTQRLLMAMVLLALPAWARAQVTPAAGSTPPDDAQSVKVGAVVFTDYTYTKAPQITDAAGNVVSLSAFNVARTYVNVTGNLSHLVSFRITPDIARETGTGSSLSGSLNFRLKYGFAQLNLDNVTGDWKQTFVRLGIQQTPFIDYDEGIYRYRFQGSVFAERDGAVSSADAGVSFHTSLPSNYGDIHVGLFNGEGNAKPEVNNQKSFQIRGTIRPFATGAMTARGLRLTAFYNANHIVKDAPYSRFIAQATFEHTRFNAGFDVIRGTDQALPTVTQALSDGWSVYVTPFFHQKGNGLEGLVRYDSFRKNRLIDARQSRTIAGLAYWFPHPGGAATAAILFDYEQVTFANFTTPQVKQERIALHGLINF